jgi:hypothetical protein
MAQLNLTRIPAVLVEYSHKNNVLTLELHPEALPEASRRDAWVAIDEVVPGASDVFGLVADKDGTCGAQELQSSSSLDEFELWLRHDGDLKFYLKHARSKGKVKVNLKPPGKKNPRAEARVTIKIPAKPTSKEIAILNPLFGGTVTVEAKTRQLDLETEAKRKAKEAA